MKLKVEVTLTKGEAKQLAEIIGAEQAQVDEKFSPFARAAINEYARMFLGQKVLFRGSDIREFRLFLLIREAFKNQIPDEQRVCDLFQCSTTQARSLIRAVMSKYQYSLSNAIDSSLTDTVSTSFATSLGWGVGTEGVRANY